MRLTGSGLRMVILLAMGSAVAGCTSVRDGLAGAAGGLSATYERFGPSWGGMRPPMPTDSLTVQRIRNADGTDMPEPLRPEAGDVWPVGEAPRATLANPEEVLRGIPAPGEPIRPRGSAASRDFLPGIGATAPSPIFETPEPPPRADRADAPRQPQPQPERGQIFQSQQGPVTTTGSAGARARTTISPQGSGLAIQDGNVTTLIGPGGTVQQVPTPR